ncbi:SoxR reducing system RseC family protein [Stutzerimonas zhaodongensis]|uniref:SoxR reducing system RseC family protein n=1 Tax=Stutzerimonas zhaodongensis TaxID=1176257 RepID=UPI000FD6EC35|nr:SoxR reducing system RseC family protein [Stutzerimonas zhaodongensis]AZZ44478.1 transcriptional regulator [Pseudomonadaceae bacterium SI-3]UNG19868.1 SoxR reducing system RseC family protein [Stutzerimonas zhaodongensis]
MIEETGRVVALAPGAVWVETERSSTCSGCSVRSGCGQGLVDRLGIRERRGLILALCDLRLSVGDTVVVGIRESVLLHGAVLVYLFPLIMLFIFAVVASQLSAPEPYVMLAGLGGFLVAWLLVRKRSQQTSIDPALQPVVLRAALAAKAE